MGVSLLNTAFNSLSDMKLWFNDRSGKPVTLADIPEIIPLRWPYFRDNWEFLADQIRNKIADYTFPDQLDSQIKDFSEFIERQRNSQNKFINPFNNSKILSRYYSIFDNIEVASIPITKEEADLLQRRITKVRNFIKTDFINIKNNLIKARDEIGDVTGTNDADYNNVYRRSSVRKLRDAKIKDITDMQTLQAGIVNIDFILANTASLNTVSIDPFALARQNANNPDIDIRLNKSGQLVRMFYGDSLESLASRYFGTPDRWIEIAIANGLKPPYIDEVGEALFLISNGSGNQINIAGTDTNGKSNIDKIYINQVVFLQSTSVKFPDQRFITNIRQIPISGEIVLELSGDANLGNYLLNEGAYVRVFKPNTTNSSFMILIPSETPIDQPSNDTVPYFLSSKAEDEKRAGVDLAVNGDMDIVFNSSSDLQLSFGLSNAIQAVQIKMMSEQGQLPRHPLFGLPVVVGKKIKDPNDLKAEIISGINQMIEQDARFSRVEQLSVNLNGSTFIISLVVRMAGSGSLVPISFNVNAG